ncbi:MAG: hypothetical protein F4204_06115 [Rhodospirillaceae bacterium]|nr:hypothetical protein [Rhodospirillaceae bacterium]
MEAATEIEMEFRLTYAGDLFAHRSRISNRSLHVHDIRKKFHEQLKKLWNEHPVFEQDDSGGSILLESSVSSIGETFEFGDFKWQPIVTKRNGLMCELDILMLRDGRPGRVQTDIDNRLKIIFDALRMARDMQELGEKTAEGKRTPKPEEIPFFVLLEDDNLISRVSVTSDMLLEPVAATNPKAAVRLIINVTVRPYKVTWDNSGFVGS